MENLAKEERLRGRGRIGELFERGGRGSAGCVAARAIPNDLPYSRLVAVAGKNLGNAVKRNRLRRRIRAAFRMQKDALPAGFDVAVIARPGLSEAEWANMAKDVVQAVAKAARSAVGPRPSPPRR